MINSFDHLHLYAADPDRTMAFYERHFGAEKLGVHLAKKTITKALLASAK